MSTEKNDMSQVSGEEVRFFMPNTESIASLENMEPKFSLTLKYKSADEWAKLEDVPIRCYYMGTKNIPNEDGEAVKCGVFVSTTECFIAGQMMLVDAVEKLDSKTAVEITYRGKSKNKATNGSTMKFDVLTLG